MNASRRKRLKECKADLEILMSKIQSVLDEEQDAYDNLPEGLQSSMKGEMISDCIDELEELMDLLEDSSDKLQSIAYVS